MLGSSLVSVRAISGFIKATWALKESILGIMLLQFDGKAIYCSNRRYLARYLANIGIIKATIAFIPDRH